MESFKFVFFVLVHLCTHTAIKTQKMFSDIDVSW